MFPLASQRGIIITKFKFQWCTTKGGILQTNYKINPFSLILRVDRSVGLAWGLNMRPHSIPTTLASTLSARAILEASFVTYFKGKDLIYLNKLEDWFVSSKTIYLRQKSGWVCETHPGSCWNLSSHTMPLVEKDVGRYWKDFYFQVWRCHKHGKS